MQHLVLWWCKQSRVIAMCTGSTTAFALYLYIYRYSESDLTFDLFCFIEEIRCLCIVLQSLKKLWTYTNSLVWCIVIQRYVSLGCIIRVYNYTNNV